MDFKILQEKALQVREKYSTLEEKRGGKSWTNENIMSGFVVDVGDLMKLVMAKEGLREMDDVDKKLAHEISDCLWSIFVLASRYGIDLETSFMQSMMELDKRIDGEGEKYK